MRGMAAAAILWHSRVSILVLFALSVYSFAVTCTKNGEQGMSTYLHNNSNRHSHVHGQELDSNGHGHRNSDRLQRLTGSSRSFASREATVPRAALPRHPLSSLSSYIVGFSFTSCQNAVGVSGRTSLHPHHSNPSPRPAW